MIRGARLGLALALVLAGPASAGAGRGAELPERTTPEVRERSVRTESGAASVRREGSTARGDAERPDLRVSLPVLGRSLTIRGDYETDVERRGGGARPGPAADDRSVLRQSAELDLHYPGEVVSFFAEGEYGHRVKLRPASGDRRAEARLERGEMWLQLDPLAGSDLTLQVGRQGLRDDRAGWWRRERDGARLLYDGDRLGAELAVAREIAPEGTDEERVAPELEDVRFLLGSVRFDYADEHGLQLVTLHQDDDSGARAPGEFADADRADEIDADLRWLGLRGSGAWGTRLGALSYWLDGLVVDGDETRIELEAAGGGRSVVGDVQERPVRGYALDAGLTLLPPVAGRPSLLLGYAVRSGDERHPAGGTDRAFSGGLPEGGAALGDGMRLGGSHALVDAELSGLQVATLGLGFRPLPESSFGLLYRHYRRGRTEDLPPGGAGIAGGGSTLGHGLDGMLDLEEWSRVRLELVGSLFRATAPFEDLHGDTAYATTARLELAF